MNIVMSGASGFIGGHLTKAFESKGWKVMPLTRNDLTLDDSAVLAKVEGADVVVNLAGTPIATRWSEEYKKAIYSSRVDTTKKIVSSLKKAGRKPALFISTSAIGIYPTRGEHTEDERHYADDFLGKVTFDWEQTALKAKEAGIRTVIFRLGIVLGSDGGALQKMLTPFRVGLGGIIGDGKQHFSWVHIEDLVKAYSTAVENTQYEGVYNLTAPNPTTNEGLTKALGHALHMPTVMHVPRILLRLQLGEAAKVVLEGQRVIPKRLLESGFTFTYAEIDQAIGDLLSDHIMRNHSSHSSS